MMNNRGRNGLFVEGLNTPLYDGDVITIPDYDGPFIVRNGWAKISDRQFFDGWYLQSLKDPELHIQAGSVNLSLASIKPRNNRPSEIS